MTYCRKTISWLMAAACAVLLSACGGGGSGDSAVNAVPRPQANVLALSVDGGPANTGYNVNRLYTTVTLCQPGSPTACQTIDHVLVDTGSTGLRILASKIPGYVQLPPLLAPNRQPLLNCVQFLDASFGWGPVVAADVMLGEKRVDSMPIQIMGDPSTRALSPVCASGNELNSATDLGANGILGVDMFTEDCGPSCAVNGDNGHYFSCNNANCNFVSGTTASLDRQVKHPVPLFDSDNNGFVVDLSAVPLKGAVSVQGRLIFGIGTQANNQLENSTVLSTNNRGLLTALFEGRTLQRGFIDTGSNGLLFDTSTMPVCESGRSGFYCPARRTSFDVDLVGGNFASIPVELTVDNALSLFSSFPNTAFPTLAGTIEDAQIMDLGLPFFYGRRVFLAIQGKATPGGTGPYYAF